MTFTKVELITDDQSPLFILNKNGHYFQATKSMDVEKLEQCDIFESLAELLEAAAVLSGTSIQEIEGNHYDFRYDIKNNRWYEICPRGYATRVITEKTIEQYLSNWSL